MRGKKYDKRFLISELHRFKDEFGLVPTVRHMNAVNGYPSYTAYRNCFGSHNEALKVANLSLNQKHHVEKLDGTETCSYCGRRADEIPNFTNWLYPNGERLCHKHGNNGSGIPDYVMGNLDINSTTGLGRAGEILVAKTLKISNEYDYNRESCNAPIDLYHKKYGWLEVKTVLLSCYYNSWTFSFDPKKNIDTYICIGLSNDRKNVEHVWVVPNEDKIKNLTTFTVRDTYRSLSNRKHWEVDSEPYDKTWQTMKLDNCKIMVDKSKDCYVEPIEHGNIISNTIKQVEQVIDKAQQSLVDF